jgi:hypothetical protein
MYAWARDFDCHVPGQIFKNHSDCLLSWLNFTRGSTHDAGVQLPLITMEKLGLGSLTTDPTPQPHRALASPRCLGMLCWGKGWVLACRQWQLCLGQRCRRYYSWIGAPGLNRNSRTLGSRGHHHPVQSRQGRQSHILSTKNAIHTNHWGRWSMWETGSNQGIQHSDYYICAEWWVEPELSHRDASP